MPDSENVGSDCDSDSLDVFPGVAESEIEARPPDFVRDPVSLFAGVADSVSDFETEAVSWAVGVELTVLTAVPDLESDVETDQLSCELSDWLAVFKAVPDLESDSESETEELSVLSEVGEKEKESEVGTESDKLADVVVRS